jgi:hypothetical protein
LIKRISKTAELRAWLWVLRLMLRKISSFGYDRETFFNEWHYFTGLMQGSLKPASRESFKAALAVLDICPFGGIPFESKEVDLVEK